MPAQSDWRYCTKCFLMFFDGYPQKGSCAAGGGHSAAGFNFALPYSHPSTPTAQDNWRFCQKCYAIFFDGYPNKGSCPQGGGHSAAGFNFVLPHDIPETPTAQTVWRFCRKCHAMFFDGYPGKGVCKAGGWHDPAGFIFVLPHDLPGKLEFHFAPIVFGGGVPVGGDAHLIIRKDGSYTFSGHFHVSGATSYDTALVWAVKDSQNVVYTFNHQGHVAGTLEPGSSNDDWNINSRNDDIANRWGYIGAGSSGKARADVNLDILGLASGLMGALGTVLQVIKIVG